MSNHGKYNECPMQVITFINTTSIMRRVVPLLVIVYILLHSCYGPKRLRGHSETIVIKRWEGGGIITCCVVTCVRFIHSIIS